MHENDYEIIRDDYGVPHVYAETKKGLAFGAGYVIAEDRLWQADLFRRQATGRLAEYGLGTIEYDHFSRMRGYSHSENTELFHNLDPNFKNMLIAYTEGINQYITEALEDPLNKLPFEYYDKGLIPEPWTEEDSIAIAQMMVRRWGEGGGNELLFTTALALFIEKNGILNGWKIFNDLCPQVDPGSDTTIVGGGNGNIPKISAIPSFIPNIIVDSAERINSLKKMDKEMSESLGLLYYFGSNGWAVTPSKSESGNTLLLGGPQMGHSIPQIVVELGLHGAGINATGMTFAGVGPAIAIGVSEWGAWTTTSGLSDGVDTYLEILHPFDKTKYLFEKNWYDMEKRTEVIYDSEGTPHEFEIYRTIHGPVLDFIWTENRGGYAISQKMTFWKQEHLTMEGVISFQECQNIDEFEEGVSKIVSSHNWLWIDRNGDVGYYHSGWYPIRPQRGFLNRIVDDRFPLIGTGKEEWLGIVPFSELPQEKNPDNGFYANWNNKPNANWKYSEAEIGPMWGEGHIVVRIQELLEADDKISFEDMIEICKNVAYHNAYGTYFKPFLLDAIESTGEDIPDEVISALEDWDCYYNNENDDDFYDDPGLTIFTEWFDEIFLLLLEDELGLELKDFTHSLLLHIFQGKDSKLKLRYNDYLDGLSVDTIIVNALENSISKLENKYGTNDVQEWLTEVDMDGFSELGALSSSEMPSMNRGTYNQIAEIPLINNKKSTTPFAYNILPPGQSGFVQYPDIPSPHAYDQMQLYIDWEFKPMLFNHSAFSFPR